MVELADAPDLGSVTTVEFSPAVVPKYEIDQLEFNEV